MSSLYLDTFGMNSIRGGPATLANVSATTANIATTVLQNYNAAGDDGFDIILLIGQSNMVGSSNLGSFTASAACPATVDYASPRIFQFPSEALVSYNQPIVAQNPLYNVNTNRTYHESIGMSFARLYHGLTGRNVLLVPSARSDTGFGVRNFTQSAGTKTVYIYWNADYVPPSAGNYNLLTYAIERTNTALAYHPVDNPTPSATDAPHPKNRLAAILWHQGEYNSAQDTDHAPYFTTEATYKAYLTAMITRLRSDIKGAANVPFIAGTLSTWWMSFTPSPGPQTVLPKVGNVAYFGVPNCYVASAQVPTEVPYNNDNTHFTGVGLRELGRRYFEQYLKSRG